MMIKCILGNQIERIRFEKDTGIHSTGLEERSGMKLEVVC